MKDTWAAVIANWKLLPITRLDGLESSSAIYGDLSGLIKNAN